MLLAEMLILVLKHCITLKGFYIRLIEFVLVVLLCVSQEFLAVSALELLVRANITVKSSIKSLVLRDTAAQVLSTLQSIYTIYIYVLHNSFIITGMCDCCLTH